MGTEIKNQQDLSQAIASLEKKADTQKNIIANSFGNLQENLKPVTLIKKHKEILFIGVLGLGTGYLIRRLPMIKSMGLLAKLAGRLIQWGLAGLLSKNVGKIRANLGPVAHHVLKRNKPDTQILNVRAR